MSVLLGNGVEDNGIVKWKLGTLEPQATGSVQLTVRMILSALDNGVIENTAVIDGDEIKPLSASVSATPQIPLPILPEQPTPPPPEQPKQPIPPPPEQPDFMPFWIACLREVSISRQEDLNGDLTSLGFFVAVNLASSNTSESPVKLTVTNPLENIILDSEDPDAEIVNDGTGTDKVFAVYKKMRDFTPTSKDFGMYSANVSRNSSTVSLDFPITSSDISSTNSTIKIPVLSIKKFVSPAVVEAGKRLTYRIDFENSGSGEATNVEIRGLLPEHTTFVSATDGGILQVREAIPRIGNGVVIWNIGTLAPGASGQVEFIAEVDSPLRNGTSITNVATIKSNQTPEMLASAAAEVKSAPILSLEKKVKVDSSQASPGDTITYILEYNNTGNDIATNVVLSDVLPEALQHVYGGTYDESSRTVQWKIDALKPDLKKRSFSFRAKVKEDLEPGLYEIQNIAILAALEVEPIESSPVSTSISVPYIQLTKMGNKRIVETGDIITYTLTVTNLSPNSDLLDVTINDTLPRGFGYLKGTGLVDGETPISASAGNNQIVFKIARIPKDKEVTISYSTSVGVNADLGDGINKAQAYGYTPKTNNDTGLRLTSNQAEWQVQVRRGIFAEKGIIIGKVFIDSDDDGVQDKGEEGMSNVRLIMEDGTTVITDESGKYSIPEVDSGLHVLRIDEDSLPEGYTLTGRDVRFAGKSNIQFVKLNSHAKADFTLKKFPPKRKTESGKQKVREAIPQSGAENGKRRTENGTSDSRQPTTSIPAENQETTSGLIILTPEEGQALNKHHITITALAQIGVSLRLTVNGAVVDEQKTMGANNFGIDISKTPQAASEKLIGACSFVSIKLLSGPNQIKVTVLDGDYKDFTIQRMVHVIGTPAKIDISAFEEQLPPKSQTELTITVQDEWGYPVLNGTFVTISLQNEYGQLLTPDVNPNTWGTQLRTQDGIAQAILVASKEVGQTTVTATCNQISASKTIQFTTPVHPFMLVGVADAQVGYLTSNGDTGGKYEQEVYNEKRLALYTRGTLFSNYLLTGSYDSARKFQDRLFRDLDPDRLYPLYGDSSSIFYEAQSSGKTYIKLEKDKCYALWGDYNTEFSGNELAAYERSFNGAKLRLDNPNYKLTAVSAKTNRTIARDEIQGLGISGFYFLTKVPVVQGSEKVKIEIRDRYHSEVVLRSKVKYRYNDYDIDYEQGSIFFKQPIPSRDSEHNPVWIVVIYETASASEKDLVLASHGEVNFKNIVGSGFDASLGATIVDEDNDIRAYQLRGVDGSLVFPMQTTFSAEFVESSSFSIKDNAWKMQLDSIPYKGLMLKAYYREIGDKYDNLSSPISEIGTLKYGANAHWRIRDISELQVEHYHTKQPISQMDITSTSADYKHHILLPSAAPITVQAKVEDLLLRNNDKKQDTHSTLATGSLRYQATKRFSATVQRDQRILGEKQTYKPNATDINLNYEVIDGLVLNLQHKIEDKDPLRLDATTFGISSKASENLFAYGKYQIGGIVAGQRNQALIGLKNRWRIRESLAVNVAFERSKIIDNISGAGDYDALSFSTEYLPRAPIKGSAKYEIRKDFSTTKQNAEVSMDLKIYDGLSIIGKHSFYLDKRKLLQQKLNLIKNHSTVGLAFRPVNSNKLNGLAKIDIKQEDNNIIEPALDSLVIIGSAEGVYQPLLPIQIMGKYALKRAQETSLSITSTTLTDIYIGRLTYQFAHRWDVAGEYRMLHQHQTNDYEHAYAAEIGVWPMNNIRIALGYNFRGSVEPDFPDSEYWAQGPFFRIETKFTE